MRLESDSDDFIGFDDLDDEIDLEELLTRVPPLISAPRRASTDPSGRSESDAYEELDLTQLL